MVLKSSNSHRIKRGCPAAHVGAHDRQLPRPWLVGWSFGTELALKYGRDHDIEGVILLSPPLHRATDAEVAAWAGDERRMVIVVPELDDYLAVRTAKHQFGRAGRIVEKDGKSGIRVEDVVPVSARMDCLGAL